MDLVVVLVLLGNEVTEVAEKEKKKLTNVNSF